MNSRSFIDLGFVGISSSYSQAIFNSRQHNYDSRIYYKHITYVGISQCKDYSLRSKGSLAVMFCWDILIDSFAHLRNNSNVKLYKNYR